MPGPDPSAEGWFPMIIMNYSNLIVLCEWTEAYLAVSRRFWMCTKGSLHSLSRDLDVIKGPVILT